MTTNYFNTLIVVADDSPTDHAVVPDLTKGSVAAQQYVMITDHPYTYTSDDVIFARVAAKEAISVEAMADAQGEYFQKGRACLRASPLPKQYGWGVHHDAEGKIALVAMDSPEYAALVADDSVTKTKAMRRSRA
ncbi:MAG: hypothetical protein KC435_10470 [Thermomicrobiales bacterium]|jgi:hypothetical protein|nr:hypothetical protein [Thermomicrobiales bacterium]